MKYYQIKTIEKNETPPRWYRTLVPSGITFSQLYVLLGYIHDEIYNLSAYFEYETRDRTIRIEEFEDGNPEYENSFYDVYDARKTYIDMFFKEGFKISQYSGRDFDLTIEVEKDAAEYPEFNAPKVIKVSRAIANEEAWCEEDGNLPTGVFDVKIVCSHPFNYAKDMEADFGNGTIMQVAENPATSEDAIRKGAQTRGAEGLHNAMLPLYDDEDIVPLLEEWEKAIGGGRPPTDNRLAHCLDNLMLEKYGETFATYTSAAMMKAMHLGTTEDDMIGRILNKALENRPEPKVIDFINLLDKKDLEFIAKEFKLNIPSGKGKKAITNVIYSQLFSEKSIVDRLIHLEDKEIELFDLIAKSSKGRFPETDDEEMIGEDLTYMLLAFPLKDERLIVPELIRKVYEDKWSHELEVERQKRVWMYKCIDIARIYYGVMSWDVLAQLFARKFKKTDMEELKDIFRTTPDLYNDMIEIGDRIVLRGYEEDDYYKYLEGTLQRDKPYYIPSRKEIEEFYDKGCILSSPSHQAMLKFLIKTFNCSQKQAELKVMEIYHQISNNERMQTVLDGLSNLSADSDGEVVFASDKDFEEFARVYINMHNHSHLMLNRGYTANDLALTMGGIPKSLKDTVITPRGPEAAAILKEAQAELSEMGINVDQERVEDMLREEKQQKIGRNDLCPCGSGRKYKKCCGKK